MYLIVSFTEVPKFNIGTNLYAYLIDKDTDDKNFDDVNFYVMITDKKPNNNVDVISIIPDELLENLTNYSFAITSKNGLPDTNRETVVIFNSRYSPYIEEFEDDITVYLPNEFTQDYVNNVDKIVYYCYNFYFKQMILNHSGKFEVFNNIISNY